MAWIYDQRGMLLHPDKGVFSSKSYGHSFTGYSGKGDGLNNPNMEYAQDVGPIPKGVYVINAPQDSDHGPYALSLTPDAANKMYKRSGFMIHGDELAHPGEHLASQGCIIVPRAVREIVWESGDRELQVV